MYKYKKYLKKSRNISQVGLGPNVRERERERREKKSNLSPAISRGFADWNSVGRELKLLYATRATYGYWNHKISPKSKVQFFTEIEKMQCPEKSCKLR